MGQRSGEGGQSVPFQCGPRKLCSPSIPTLFPSLKISWTPGAHLHSYAREPQKAADLSGGQQEGTEEGWAGFSGGSAKHACVPNHKTDSDLSRPKCHQMPPGFTYPGSLLDMTAPLHNP